MSTMIRRLQEEQDKFNAPELRSETGSEEAGGATFGTITDTCDGDVLDVQVLYGGSILLTIAGGNKAAFFAELDRLLTSYRI